MGNVVFSGSERVIKAGFMELQLKAEFIELDNALKVMNLVSSGAEAKRCIQSGLVKVNAEAQTRIRRKLWPGDLVEFGEHRIKIVKN